VKHDRKEKDMRKLASVTGLAVALGIAATTPVDATAQSEKLSVEGRLGAAIPVGELSDLGGEAGLALGADILYTPHTNLSVYGGYGWAWFNDDIDMDVSASGFDAGLKVLFPRPGSAMPWVRGGLILQEASFEDLNSDYALGFEGGVGVDLSLRENVSIVPSVKFRRFTPDFDTDVALDEMDLSFFMIDLAAHVHM
jgi:opacity protein-like surface antigen